MWVANGGDDTVTKLRASDGMVEGTFPAGSHPAGHRFRWQEYLDCELRRWNGDGLECQRRHDAGRVSRSEPPPTKVLFDGTNIWVTNYYGDTVTKLRAADGANLGSFPTGRWPDGLAFDGANIWVVNFRSHDFTKLRASDGTLLGTFRIGGEPLNAAFDGMNLWVTDAQNAVRVVRASNGALRDKIEVGSLPVDVLFDGSAIWVSNAQSNTVSKITR